MARLAPRSSANTRPTVHSYKVAYHLGLSSGFIFELTTRVRDVPLHFNSTVAPLIVGHHVPTNLVLVYNLDLQFVEVLPPTCQWDKQVFKAIWMTRGRVVPLRQPPAVVFSLVQHRWSPIFNLKDDFNFNLTFGTNLVCQPFDPIVEHGFTLHLKTRGREVSLRLPTSVVPLLVGQDCLSGFDFNYNYDFNPKFNCPSSCLLTEHD